MRHRLKTLICVMLTFFPFSALHAEAISRGQPDCALTQLPGQQVLKLSQYKGKVVYVDFWASWCGPCAQSFPFMNTLHHELAGKGLQIIGVNLDEMLSDAQDFLAQHPAHFTVAADAEQQCAKDFNVKAMPSTYLIDRNGVIRYEHLGFRAGEAEQLREWVTKLLAEKPTGQ